MSSPELVFCPDITRLEQRLNTIAKRCCGRIIIAGAGTHTDLIWEALSRNFPHISLIIDKDPVCELYKGIEVVKRDEFTPEDGDAIIISSHSFESEIYEELTSCFGEKVEIHRLYEQDCLSHFLWEMHGIDYSWEEIFSALNHKQQDRSTGAVLNATGIGLALGGYFAKQHLAKIDALKCDERDRTDYAEKMFEELQAQLIELLRANSLGRTAIVDLYNVGSHTVETILDLSEHLQSEGLVDSVVVLLTDPKTTHPKLGKERKGIYFIDFSYDTFSGAYLPNLPECTSRELQAAVESCDCESVRLFYHQHRTRLINNVKVGLLYARVWEWIDEVLDVKVLLNIQDNRLLSRSFYLSSLVGKIPVVQVQHGVLSSVLGPFWADLFVGWKDQHSHRVYNEFAPQRESFLSVGNLFLNGVRKRMEEFPIALKHERKQRLVFLFQGPVYWHGKHHAVFDALSILKEAIDDLPEGWDIWIKMRNSSGKGLLRDFFGHCIGEKVHLIRHDRPLVEVLAEVDAVCVMSSSGRDEAEYFGFPVFALERNDDTPIISFGKEGTAKRVTSGAQLLQELRSINRFGQEEEFLTEKNPHLAADDGSMQMLYRRIEELFEKTEQK